MPHSHSHHPPHGHAHSHSHSHPHPHPHPPHHDSDLTPADPDRDHHDPHRTEAHHQATVQATFDLYKRHALATNQQRRADYYALARSHRALVPDYNALLADVDARLATNAELVQRMADTNPFPPPTDAALDAPAPTEADHERLRSTLRQCVRDWSADGKPERDATYTPILAALDAAYAGLGPSDKAQIKVLVPGAGLGRLAWEIVRAGYSCQANEFSLYMLIASHFILNHTAAPNAHALHPYLHSLSNVRSRADLLAPSYVPDVRPDLIADLDAQFSFAAGDFVDVYGADEQQGQWDSCVTCFFVDTARNVVRYLEVIHGLLRDGGTWINCGPTLWHFENDPAASSLALTLDDLKALARRVGFDISDEREIETCYTTDPRSTLRHTYQAAFWTARKVAPPARAEAEGA
ncbi:hypothetical protein JCM9279_001783 [Rhodotorula babjevae]